MTLSCPDGANYAAIAKQLHETALEAEARIFSLEYMLRAAVNRPTIVQITTSAITGIASSLVNETIIGPEGAGGATTLFNNTKILFGSVDESNMFFPPGGPSGSGLGAGVYEVGIFASAVASGAVTDNSQRVFRIKQERVDLTQPSGVALVQEASILQFETNTGVGADCCASGTFKMQENDRIAFTFAHDNAASTVNVSAGTVVWLHRLSDSTILAVI